MIQELVVQEGFTVIRIENDTKDILNYSKPVNFNFIQMHFCLNKDSKLHYGPSYSLSVDQNNSVLLYNPIKALPINLSLRPKGKHLVFVVSIKIFHSFFSQVANLIPFLKEENRDKKYYLDKLLSPSEILVLNQIFDKQRNNNMQELYVRGKAYETLSLYFGQRQDQQQSCPFLDSEENVEKIKKAKQIVISNMSEPPSLQELATEIGLSLPKLKEGFKHIYGESVFHFLLDYKLEYARKQLLSKKYNVSEISLQVGYSTASHFISAFKKKYGTTPKQYIMSVT